MSRAAEEKELGGAAWAAGDYIKAIEHFTNGINECGDNDIELLKVLHSNRSACYLKLKRATEALNDGITCAELDPNWNKGLTRKADALMALMKYSEALTIFEELSRMGDAGATTKVEQIRRATSRTGAPQSPFQTATPASKLGGQPVTFNSRDRLGTAQSYARMAVVACGFLYIIPLQMISGPCHRIFLISAIFNYIIGLYKSYGIPQFNSEYLQRLLPDTYAQLLFLAVMQFSAHGYFLAMLPILLLDLAHLTPYILRQIANKSPEIIVKANAIIESQVPKMINLSIEDWNRMPVSDKWNIFNTVINKFSATAEVMQGAYLIVELIMPTRNFMLIYLWYQYLTMRYMQDRNGCLKEALAAFDMQIMSVVGHQYCPGVIRDGYVVVKGFLHKQIPVPGQPRPSMIPSSCNIM